MYYVALYRQKHNSIWVFFSGLQCLFERDCEANCRVVDETKTHSRVNIEQHYVL